MVQQKKKINVKERFADGEIDLSMSNLDDIPVNDIASMKKAVNSLDVSNNRLVYLPENFIILTHLTKLDLSKNELKELPENFGNLSKLKHLDLYNNKLQHLPVSFGQLVNLKFLDLKYNPLVPAIEKIAGQCLDTKGCQQCARNIVQFYKKLAKEIADVKEVRQKTREKQLEINKKRKEQEKKKERKEKDYKVENQVPLVIENKKEPTKKQKQKRRTNKTKRFRIPLCIFLLCISFIFWIFLSSKFPVAEQISDFIGDNYNSLSSKLPMPCEYYAIEAGKLIKTLQFNTKLVVVNVTESINSYVISVLNYYKT